MTERSNGKIAGFVDFDWGASLCPQKGCPHLPVRVAVTPGGGVLAQFG